MMQILYVAEMRIFAFFVENFELGRSEATESDLKYCFLSVIDFFVPDVCHS